MYLVLSLQPSYWEGNRQESQGSLNRGNRAARVRFFSLKILCCHDDTWFHPNLTFLKPWAHQCLFLMEMFLLSYVNETTYLLWNLPSKWFHLRLTFFLFQTLGWQWLNKPVFVSTALWLGMTHHVPSYLKNAYCGRGAGETPSASRCLSYLINSFLTDMKHLAKD